VVGVAYDVGMPLNRPAHCASRHECTRWSARRAWNSTEVSPLAPTRVSRSRGAMRAGTIETRSYGFSEARPEHLAQADAEENAEVVLAVLRWGRERGATADLCSSRRQRLRVRHRADIETR